jgi:hypothetical protein
MVGVEHFEQALVVRDGEHAEIELFGGVFDTAAHEAQRIDVEAGIEFVEHRDLGPQDCELEGLDPLLLTTGEIDVQRTREELVVETEPGSFGSDPRGGEVVRRRTARRPRASTSTSLTDTPGTSTGYCRPRNSPPERALPRREPDEIDASRVIDPP